MMQNSFIMREDDVDTAANAKDKNNKDKGVKAEEKFLRSLLR